ncbi:MAG: glycosyltransferase family 4 protein [Ahrensia sp.]|nr:glycosyltransferase family 4 protein [Ahrensia sp.]
MTPPDFLFIGEMRMLKGPDLMLHAMHRLKAEGSQNISAIMVGDGPDRDEIQALITQLNLQANVTMRPPMPARAAFELAKTVVMPSRAEAMPYIVLEALGAHMPLIATKVGGIPEIFGTVSDILIEPTIHDLTIKMRMALGDLTALKSRMPDHAALKANFSVEAMASTMLDVYETAIKSRNSA